MLGLLQLGDMFLYQSSWPMETKILFESFVAIGWKLYSSFWSLY